MNGLEAPTNHLGGLTLGSEVRSQILVTPDPKTDRVGRIVVDTTSIRPTIRCVQSISVLVESVNLRDHLPNGVGRMSGVGRSCFEGFNSLDGPVANLHALSG